MCVAPPGVKKMGSYESPGVWDRCLDESDPGKWGS
jgi:hypothetical protein